MWSTLRQSRHRDAAVHVYIELAWQQTSADCLIRHRSRCLRAMGFSPRRVAWSHWEQIQYNSFSCQPGGNAPLSSLSDDWPSHFVSWHLGRTKDRLPQEELQRGQHVLGLRGEATGKHNKREWHAGQQKNRLMESGLLHVQALAVIQQCVSVWSLACCKCL